MRYEDAWRDEFGWRSPGEFTEQLKALKSRKLQDIRKISTFVLPEEKEEYVSSWTQNWRMPLMEFFSREPGILIFQFNGIEIGIIEERVEATLYVRDDISEKLIADQIKSELIESDLHFRASENPELLEEKIRPMLGKVVTKVFILGITAPFPAVKYEKRHAGLEFHFNDGTGLAFGSWLGFERPGDPFPTQGRLMLLDEIDENKIEERIEI